MSMCHFCFRCRRPACPDCWDEVNGVCGSCVQEAHLPFRTQSPLMRGMQLAPARQEPITPYPTGQAKNAPLTCIYPGRFHGIPLPAITGVPAVSVRPTTPIPTVRTGIVAEGPQTLPNIAVPVTGVSLHPEPGVHQTTVIASASGTQVKTAPLSPTTDALPSQDIAEMETRPGRQKRSRNIGRKIERVITIILLSILLLVIALIVAAAVSAEMNTWVTDILHVDIRAEIAYLWQLITHLH